MSFSLLGNGCGTLHEVFLWNCFLMQSFCTGPDWLPHTAAAYLHYIFGHEASNTGSLPHAYGPGLCKGSVHYHPAVGPPRTKPVIIYHCCCLVIIFIGCRFPGKSLKQPICPIFSGGSVNLVTCNRCIIVPG